MVTRWKIGITAGLVLAVWLVANAPTVAKGEFATLQRKGNDVRVTYHSRNYSLDVFVPPRVCRYGVGHVAPYYRYSGHRIGYAYRAGYPHFAAYPRYGLHHDYRRWLHWRWLW